MRQVVRRRGLLGFVAAGGTVAAAGRPGKPAAQTALPGLEALIPADPPAPPPPAVLLDAEGRAHRLEEFAGNGLVINLWATWCVPCVAELPALAALAGQVKDDGIRVLPLSSDRGGGAVVAEYYRRHGIAGLPVWLDPKGAAARAWGARGLPTTLLIDPRGRERGRLEGAADWAGAATIAGIRRLIGPNFPAAGAGSR